MRLIYHFVSVLLYPKLGGFKKNHWKGAVPDVPSHQPNFHQPPGNDISKNPWSGGKGKCPSSLLFSFHRSIQEFGVNLEGETTLKLAIIDTYSDRSLHHMGYKKKNVAGWSQRKELQVERMSLNCPLLGGRLRNNLLLSLMNLRPTLICHLQANTNTSTSGCMRMSWKSCRNRWLLVL